jgi:hypothetical protein
MVMNISINKIVRFSVVSIGLLATFSCTDKFLPESLDSFDKEAGFTQKLYRPQLGKTSVMTNNFNGGNSTLPFTFELVDIKRFDGSEAPELTENFPVKVWQTPYLGTEKSIAEIEAKRITEYRPLFQIRKHSGEFVMWGNANSSFVRCAPDSAYIFDVLAKNSGGYAYTTRMQLIPTREVDYEPNTVDLESGMDTLGYQRPLFVNNVRDATTGFRMFTDNVKIYFRKNEEQNVQGHTLTFRFYQSDYTPIDPARFNLTKWEELIHGFDIEKTATYVRYKVAYPIPLFKSKTRYTNINGDRASITIKYNRIGVSGFREDSAMQFDFAIFKEGNWEILFVFDNKGPLFKDGVRTDN